jgi:hypothetical protein
VRHPRPRKALVSRPGGRLAPSAGSPGLLFRYRYRERSTFPDVLRAAVIVVGLLLLWSARADAAVTGDWGAYAAAASRFAVPLPDVYVHREDCPAAGMPDGHLGAASCSSAVSGEIWLPDWAFDRFTLAHELGHQFDRQYLTDADRAWLRRLMHAPARAWFTYAGADEWFADYYADCATRAWRRGSVSNAAYAPLPSPTRLTRVCAAITAWGLVRAS